MENNDDLRTYLRVPNYIINRKIFPLRSCLEKIIVQGYKALGLEYFFTAGPDEVKAWTIQKFTKAPQAAGRIHTDFEKGFIMAEVMKFNDFKEEGSEAAAKVGVIADSIILTASTYLQGSAKEWSLYIRNVASATVHTPTSQGASSCRDPFISEPRLREFPIHLAICFSVHPMLIKLTLINFSSRPLENTASRDGTTSLRTGTSSSSSLTPALG